MRSESVSTPFTHTACLSTVTRHQPAFHFPSRHCSEGTGFLGGPGLFLWCSSITVLCIQQWCVQGPRESLLLLWYLVWAEVRAQELSESHISRAGGWQNFGSLVYYLHDGVNWEVSSLHRLFVIQIAWFSAGKLYGDTDYLEERHRHRFEVRMWACSFYSAKKGMERPAQWVFCPTRWIQSWRSAWKSKAWSLLAKMLKAKGWRFWSWKVTG